MILAVDSIQAGLQLRWRSHGISVTASFHSYS
jgi:hypothetical protein